MVSAPWPGCLAVTKEELDELADLGVKVLAWSSLATGFFGGRERLTGTARQSGPTRAGGRARRRRRQLAAAVALAYVLHQPGHVLPVVRPAPRRTLDEMLAAAGFRLGDEELEWLETG